jgi:alkylhydroperoxidase family enzyme
MRRTLVRLGYSADDSDVAERMRKRRGGQLTPLDAALLHSPEFADGWNSLLGAVRERSTLPPDIRELVILRVAELNLAPYEWAAHEPVARKAGLTDRQLTALRSEDGAAAGVFTGAQLAALRYADAMTREVIVAEAVFQPLRDHFSERQVLELTATVAAYNMVSRVLVALRISGDSLDAEPA